MTATHPISQLSPQLIHFCDGYPAWRVRFLHQIRDLIHLRWVMLICHGRSNELGDQLFVMLIFTKQLKRSHHLSLLKISLQAYVDCL